jgi:site-specific DNA-methyltransferase (adenine-specific)
MKELSDKSVHLIITSPPYWQLKDYGSDDQIGFNDSYEKYINNLNLVWRECYRTLHDGCRLCINIGDQFARSIYYGRYKIIPIRTEIIKFCETIGFDYMGAIIWQKTTTMNTTGGATIMGSFPYPRNGIIKLDYEFILIFRKQGEAPKVDKVAKEKSKISKEEWNDYFRGHWNFNGVKQDGHVAMFPEELPKRLIKMFSFVGDTVLDPFLGSGTTSLAAKNLGRNSVGYEINPHFLSIIKKKISTENSLNLNQDVVKYFRQKQRNIDFDKEINLLPYVFKDPYMLDKKIDPKKMQFGSKIDGNKPNKKDKYFKVKEVLSPELIKLENDILVRLLGVKKKEKNINEAINYLNDKIKGKQVFLRFDSAKYDQQNNMLCYVYLRNKTFVNAHFIKSKLVEVDKGNEYKYKQKFLNF